ncbi:DeoR/GlpR family DNA-binding transcription regulator [Bacillus xiapuensis]|uniref:DeoR/GlpR family DNA-binding transcription regulator n=1 Tax=Bacillus xiapuensis TaxID=2014075 RepID=UPI000C230561|nr:DeoR/GlpR family DNA-binding transcription regulator [Bacillus xiapuensis]
MSVVSEERKRLIIEKVEQKGKVKVTDLANEFSVSTETIRRYLEDLDKDQKLKKVYGGAVKQEASSLMEPSMVERNILNISQKKRIAYQAATFIRDGDVIVIDEGSTTLQLVPYLLPYKNLTIMTNSFSLVNQLISAVNKETFNGQIVFLGGKVNAKHFRVSGTMSQEIMNQLYFDKAFISVDGILPSFGLSSYDLDKAKMSKMMIKQAQQSFVLADYSKINQRGTYQIVQLTEVDYLLSDQDCPGAWSRVLLQNQVQWVKC